MCVMRQVQLAQDAYEAKHHFEQRLEWEVGGQGQTICCSGFELLLALSPVYIDAADVHKPPKTP